MNENEKTNPVELTDDDLEQASGGGGLILGGIECCFSAKGGVQRDSATQRYYVECRNFSSVLGSECNICSCLVDSSRVVGVGSYGCNGSRHSTNAQGKLICC